MSFFFEQSFSTHKSSNGTKKAAFSITKSKNGLVQHIKGESTNNNLKNFLIEQNIKKFNNGKFITKKHKVYKIKSSDISKLLKPDPRNKNKQNTVKSNKKEPASVKPMKDMASVKPKKESASIKPMKDMGSVKPMKDMASVKPKKESASVKPMKDMASVKPNKESASVKPKKVMNK